MNKRREPHQEALETLAAAFGQNQGFFAVRVPGIYERLRYLVRCSCHHLRNGDAARAQAILQEELFRLFGVPVAVPRHRQLSLLAGLIRQVLVSHARMQRRSEAKGGVEFLVHELRQAASTPDRPIDVLAVDAALNALQVHFPVGGCLLELRYFARLALRYLALETNLSTPEIECTMRFAKAWLVRHLQNHGNNEPR